MRSEWMKKKTFAERWIALAMLTLAIGVPAMRAQQGDDQASGRRAFAGMQRATGEVTAVNGATVSLKTDAGDTLQVVTTDNTRIMKGRGMAIKIADVKVGDGATAAGNLDAATKTLHAAILFVVDAAQVKAMKDNLGKTYITGKVTAIDLDNARMTVERPDKVSQVIGFDDSTSFHRGRGRGGAGGGMGAMGGGGAGGGAGAPAAADAGESITLADVKVGDNVTGQGSVKGGTFVPTQMMVMTPGQRRPHPADGAGGPPAAGAPPSAGSGAGPQ